MNIFLQDEYFPFEEGDFLREESQVKRWLMGPYQFFV